MATYLRIVWKVKRVKQRPGVFRSENNVFSVAFSHRMVVNYFFTANWFYSGFVLFLEIFYRHFKGSGLSGVSTHSFLSDSMITPSSCSYYTSLCFITFALLIFYLKETLIIMVDKFNWHFLHWFRFNCV